MNFDPETFIASQTWTFAKTLAHNPHYYIVRGKGHEPEVFDEFVRVIRSKGEERVWGNRIYIYFRDANGLLYWTMGWPLWFPGAGRDNHTYIINRVLPDDDKSVPFDFIKHAHIKFSGPDGKDPRGK